MTIMHASLVIFQTYKNEILRRVDSFGWLLWLYFYPSFTSYENDLSIMLI
jgi:hypothetical protein